MKRRLLPLLLALLLVAGCSAGDLSQVQGFLQQWASAHATQIAANQLGIPSGDAYVDAAVDAGKTVADLITADADMAAGRANFDPAAMDAALTLRPHDWTYEMSRANLALQMGDIAGYHQFLAGADADAPSTDQVAFFAQDYDELVEIADHLASGSGYQSYDQCTLLYQSLQAEAQNSDPPSAAVDLDMWTQRLAACEQIAP